MAATAMLILVCSAVVGISLVWIAWRVGSVRVWAITAIALTYPIGKSMQTLVVGPQWIRHYLSDFGFVPFLVLAWVVAVCLMLLRRGETDFGNLWILPATMFFLGISLLGEGVQWMMGKADWVDAACEVASGLLTVVLLRKAQSIRWERTVQ